MTRDPFEVFTRQPYEYANDTPLDVIDPLGLWGWNPWDDAKQAAGDVAGAFNEGAHLAIDAVTDPAYLVYWGALDANGAIHWALGKAFGRAGCRIADIVGTAFVPAQAMGLGIDAGGDWLKEHVLGVPDYSVRDEGIPNAYLLGSQAGPLARHLHINWRHNFPGIHADGHIDWLW